MPVTSARAQARDQALRRYAAVVGVVAVLGVVGYAFRLAPNERHAEGVAAAARLDAAFDAARVGRLEVTADVTEVAPGVLGALVAIDDADAVVLVTPAPRDCYALWWTDALVREGRVVDDALPCVPAPVVGSQRPTTFERAGPAQRDVAAPYPWDRVLPPPQRLRVFVIPGAIVAAAIVLSVLVRASVVLITGAPVTAPDPRRGR